MEKWTIEQQRKYRSQIKELGIDDETRRLMLRRITGKRSTSEIGFDDMSRVINEQEKMLGRSGGRPRTTQDDLIYKLADELGWHRGTGRLQGFLRRMAGQSSVMALTVKQKSKVIEGLKSMRDGGRGERESVQEVLIEKPTEEALKDYSPDVSEKLRRYWQRREEAAKADEA